MEPLRRFSRGYYMVMLLDILIALIIVVLAVSLGLTVHPLFWLVIILAAFWMFGRRGTRRGARY